MPPAPVLLPLIVDAVMVSVPKLAMPPPPALFRYWKFELRFGSTPQLPFPPRPPRPPVPAPLTMGSSPAPCPPLPPTPPTPVKLPLMVEVVIVVLPRL